MNKRSAGPAKHFGVDEVFKSIASWELAHRAFRREIRYKSVRLRRRPIDGTKAFQKVYVGRYVDGTEYTVSKDVADYWTRRVSRLRAEAERRVAAKDWNWFYWLEEFSSMMVSTIREDFANQYTKLLTVGAQARRAHKTASATANHKRRYDADRRVMEPFRTWQMRHANDLQPLNAREQVRKYIATRPTTSRLGARDCRRLRAIADRGEIPPLN